MKSIDSKKFLPHIVALVLFTAIASVYFYPTFLGYRLKQGDIKQHKGMAHEIRSHRADFNEEPLWLGNMFSGMPAYQVSATQFKGNIIKVIDNVLKFGLPHPVYLLFLYMLGFYILLMCLRINPWLSIVGAIAFAFSSYFLVIIEAGHNSKALSIAYMPALLGGIISILRGRIWLGGLITVVFMGLHLNANHLQITYYLIFVVFIYGIYELVYQLRAGHSKEFFKRAGIAVIAVLIGVLPNIGNILTTYEYSKFSTRSPSELTINPDGSSNEGVKSTGLDKDYITRWSYGIEETITLLVPNAKGGKSGAILADEEEIQRLRQADPQFFNFMVNQYQNEQFIVNTYWGNQPFTSGPVYVGAIVFFLAVLALFFVKSRLIISLGIVTVLALLLSWGKNLMWFTDFFIDYIPLYNKFRAVSMILVIVELVLPIFAVLFLSELYQNRDEILRQKKKILSVSGVFVGVLLVFWVTPDTFFDFLSLDEKQHMNEQLQENQQQSNAIYAGFESIKDYRIDLFKSDLMNSLKYIILALAVLLLYLYGKLNKKVFVLGIGALVLVDLWSLNKQFLNNEEKPGVSKTAADRFLAYQPQEQKLAPYAASPVDKTILQNELNKNAELAQQVEQKIAEVRAEKGRLDQRDIEKIQFLQLMRNTHYRVLNSTAKMDEDAKTAYFHKTLGGYHAAKMKKYQELIDFELGREHFQLRQAFLQGGKDYAQQLLPQMNVTNMLNAKYIIGAVQAGQGQQLAVIQNPHALGNSWLVDDVKFVADANEEIKAFENTDVSKSVIVRESYKDHLSLSYSVGSTDYIKLESYLPNELIYTYQSANNAFAVFSEIFYDKGWTAYINGEEVPHYRVNYTLRGLELPAGSGEVKFVFDPDSYEFGVVATWVSSVIILLLIGFVAYRKYNKMNS